MTDRQRFHDRMRGLSRATACAVVLAVPAIFGGGVETTAVAQDATAPVQSAASEFAGRWRGILNEDGRRTVIELSFSDDAGRLDGRFAAYQPGAEKPSLERPVVGITRSGDALSFAVPLTGSIDQRTIFLRLTRVGRVLTGAGRPNRAGAAERDLVMIRMSPPS